jgi:hypothetical protein
MGGALSAIPIKHFDANDGYRWKALYPSTTKKPRARRLNIDLVFSGVG